MGEGEKTIFLMQEQQGSVESLNESLAQKLASKYDHSLEGTIRQWMSGLVEHPDLLDSSVSLQALLKDGVIICELMNKLVPNAIKRINRTTLPFKQMENISNYAAVCESMGLSESERFRTVDIYDGKDMNCVMNHFRTMKNLADKHSNDLTSLFKGKAVQVQAPKPVSISRLEPSTSFRSDWKTNKRNSVNTMEENTSQPSVSSLEDDISTKEEFKYSPELEQGAKTWIRKLLGDETLFTKDSLANELKSGTLFCKIINTIQPNIIPRVNTSKFPYAQMENIGNYLKACVSMGLPKTDLFDTPDLYDKKNLNLVILHIHVLARFVANMEGYTGPKIDDSSRIRTLYSSSLSETKELDKVLGEEIPRELGKEECELVEWMNDQLHKKYPELVVSDLSCRGIKTGVLLLRLLEVLTKSESVGFFEENPEILWHCMQNASLVLRFLYQQTFEELDINSQDIILGNISSISRLLSYLRDKFDMEYLFFESIK